MAQWLKYWIVTSKQASLNTSHAIMPTFSPIPLEKL